MHDVQQVVKVVAAHGPGGPGWVQVDDGNSAEYRLVGAVAAKTAALVLVITVAAIAMMCGRLGPYLDS